MQASVARRRARQLCAHVTTVGKPPLLSIGRVGGPAGGPTRRTAEHSASRSRHRVAAAPCALRSAALAFPSLRRVERASLPAAQYSVAASVCASAQAARARGVARIALPGVRCGICSCCVRVAPCAGSVAPDVAWCSGRLCELWCKRHGWRCGLLVQACRELGSLSCAVAEGASPVARAGNAQKTAMSRAKNQAKADSSKQGVEPQRERCVPSPTRSCARGAGDGFLLSFPHLTPALVPSTGSQLKQNAAALTLKVCSS